MIPSCKHRQNCKAALCNWEWFQYEDDHTTTTTSTTSTTTTTTSTTTTNIKINNRLPHQVPVHSQKEGGCIDSTHS